MKLFADFIAIVHGLWVVTVIIGPLISWKFRPFRWVHLVMMATTFLIMISGQLCPLTIWEQDLRAGVDAAGQFSGGFINNYVTKAVHVEISPWAIFFALTGWMFFWYGVYTTKWEK